MTLAVFEWRLDYLGDKVWEVVFCFCCSVVFCYACVVLRTEPQIMLDKGSFHGVMLLALTFHCVSFVSFEFGSFGVVVTWKIRNTKVRV